MKHNVKAMRSI